MHIKFANVRTKFKLATTKDDMDPKQRSSGLGFTLPDYAVIYHVIYKHIIDARCVLTSIIIIIGILAQYAGRRSSAHRNALVNEILEYTANKC